MQLRTQEALFLGIDAGGTHTTAVLITADGSVKGLEVAGAANHTTMGIESARLAITQAVTGAMRNIAGQPLAVVLGSAGLEEPGDLQVARELLPAAMRDTHIVFDTDAINALEGALGGAAGIVVAAGTGSIALGRDITGRRAHVGGWGWRVGDEGSAYWIGQRILSAVFRAADGRCPGTLLGEAVLDKLRLPSYCALRDWVYSDDRVPGDIAQLSPLVDAAAAAGDDVAGRIIAAAADELASAAKTVACALDMQSGGVSYTGGIFQSTVIRNLFIERVETSLPGYQVAPPILPPGAGAALHAWRVGHAVAAGKHSQQDLWHVAIPASVVAQIRQGIRV